MQDLGMYANMTFWHHVLHATVCRFRRHKLVSERDRFSIRLQCTRCQFSLYQMLTCYQRYRQSSDEQKNALDFIEGEWRQSFGDKQSQDHPTVEYGKSCSPDLARLWREM